MFFPAFADALSNPIAYQSELEKRAKQLSVLEDDLVVDVPFVKSTLQVRCSFTLYYEAVCQYCDAMPGL